VPTNNLLKVLTLGCLAIALTGCEESPTGRKRVALIPESQMAEMGDRAFQSLVQTQPLAQDSRANARLTCITRALIAALPPEHAREEWSVALFQDQTPNAFALPGGKMGVNSGMLRVARTQDQLAAVIAHEIAHVIADHGNERLTQEMAVQGGLMIVDLLADNPGSLGHEVLRGALGLGAQYGLLLPYSRTHESEADQLGLELMAKAGFDPRESLTLWRNMAKAGGGQPLEFLSTHPAHETRLEELKAAMGPAMATFEAARRAGHKPACG
jgi:predicted Zn-dependent protease